MKNSMAHLSGWTELSLVARYLLSTNERENKHQLITGTHIEYLSDQDSPDFKTLASYLFNIRLAVVHREMPGDSNVSL